MMSKKVQLILGLILLALVVIFVIQNVAIVSIRLAFWTISMSGALLFFLFYIAGVICGGLGLSYYFHLQKKPDNSTSQPDL
jgi:uncharacterized integral membrane protein